MIEIMQHSLREPMPSLTIRFVLKTRSHIIQGLLSQLDILPTYGLSLEGVTTIVASAFPLYSLGSLRDYFNGLCLVRCILDLLTTRFLTAEIRVVG